MRLNKLLEGIYTKKLDAKYSSLEIGSISADSREVDGQAMFIALKGQKGHGLDYLNDVIKKGCRVIACDNFSGVQPADGICYLEVKDANKFLREVVNRFYDEPSKKLKIAGVTGTNGKTTITYLIEAFLKQAGMESGVVGTVNYRFADKVLDSKNTTPGLIQNQKFLAQLIERKIKYCIMEVSSHALDQGRVDLIDFGAGIFTNLTVDHLDYHRTLEEYFTAKQKLFTGLNPKASAIINIDDSFGQRLTESTKAKVITYGIKNKADVMALDIKATLDGSRFKLAAKGSKAVIETKLMGRHNIYNLLAAIAYCLSEGIKIEFIQQALESFYGAPGRLERVDFGQKFYVFVDYAHTDDALKNILSAIREVSKAKIILVFGCGGDRDKSKRPMMGKIAGGLADFSIVTSDNPRSEDPQAIINEIIKGFGKNNYIAVVNREAAIKKAVEIARPGDIVILAGKGHENYQIFKDKTIKFDEKEILRKNIHV